MPSTSAKQMIDLGLDFIREYWAELAVLFVTWDNVYGDGDPIEYVHRESPWSCFSAAPMVAAMFGVYEPWLQNPSGWTSIETVDSFEKGFYPGYVYGGNYGPETDVPWIHVFNLVYLFDGRVLYGDYFLEADRGADAFRLDVITEAEALDLIDVLINGGCDQAREFHHGGPGYLCDVPGELDMARQPIAMLPTPASIMQECWKSLTRVAPEAETLDEALNEIFANEWTDDEVARENISLYKELASKLVEIAGPGAEWELWFSEQTDHDHPW